MFKIEIKTGNAAFHDDDCGNGEFDEFATMEEVVRILRNVIQKLNCGRTEGKCIDYNGNAVGEWKLDA